MEATKGQEETKMREDLDGTRDKTTTTKEEETTPGEPKQLQLVTALPEVGVVVKRPLHHKMLRKEAGTRSLNPQKLLLKVVDGTPKPTRLRKMMEEAGEPIGPARTAEVVVDGERMLLIF